MVGAKATLFIFVGLEGLRVRFCLLDLLRRLLKNKLLIDSNTLLPFVSPDAISAPPTLDSFLKQLTRQGYLEQVCLVLSRYS
jgi:predicted Ser/Thr protein kinase